MLKTSSTGIKNGRSLGRTGIGVDVIDVPAATRHGIVVTNVPSYCEEEVSAYLDRWKEPKGEIK